LRLKIVRAAVAEETAVLARNENTKKVAKEPEVALLTKK